MPARQHDRAASEWLHVKGIKRFRYNQVPRDRIDGRLLILYRPLLFGVEHLLKNPHSSPSAAMAQSSLLR